LIEKVKILAEWISRKDTLRLLYIGVLVLLIQILHVRNNGT